MQPRAITPFDQISNSFVEVIMKKFICTFISVAVLSLAVVVSAGAQSFGTRVEANIPFDFTVGKKTFKAGSYDMSIVRGIAGVYYVTLFDENGRSISRSLAVENAGTIKKGSLLEFSVDGGDHYLEAFRSPTVAYSVLNSARKQSFAQAKNITIPVSGPQ
jgi:hypothetical protein